MYPYKIFGIFHMYGFMIAVGILACFCVFTLCSKKFKVEDKFIDFVFFNAIVAIGLGFGAAALFQATYNYIENPAGGFKFGGITFIGGLIGGVASFLIGYAIFRKRYKGRISDILSIAPCSILIAHAFGRIGCLFAGCCHGAETDAWYGIYMYAGSLGYKAKVVPTQLFEAIFLFALFAVCLILLLKKKFRYNMSVYLIAYGIFRFCNEYLRADHRGELIPGVTPSQFWSIMMVLIGVGLIFFLKWLFKKRDEELALINGANPEQPTAEQSAEDQPTAQADEAANGQMVWREATETAEERAEAQTGDGSAVQSATEESTKDDDNQTAQQ